MRLLLAEDNHELAHWLEKALVQGGFAVDCVSDGRAADHLLQGERYAVAILDIGMPGFDGLEVVQRLRKRGQTLPVLFLTARSDEVDRIVGLELGGDDYVTKPFSPREVASRVRAILRRLHANGESRGQPEKPAKFAVDRDGLRIAYHGQWLALTRYEYLLLALLLERPGRILSRPQIMAAVWQDDGESLERTVDTHIKTLRGKLRAVRDDEVILTHRGLGYSLAA